MAADRDDRARVTLAYSRRGRIGLIVPSTNAVMERDLWRMAPDGVSVLTARMTYDRALPPIQRLERQLSFAPQAVHDLCTADVGVVVYGCTSGSFFRGRAWEDGHLREISQLAGRPVVLTARSVVDAARALGLERVAVFTPYVPEVNERLAAYLRASGLAVGALLGPPSYARPETVPPEMVAAALRAADASADGYVLACTALPVLDAIADLEREFGRPVITSNQAAMWAALRAIGIHDPLGGFGRLLA